MDRCGLASMMAVMARIVPTAFALCLAAPLAACPLLHVEHLDPQVAVGSAEPSVTVAGDDFLLGWQARLDDGVAALRFRRFTVDGRRLGGGEIARGSGWFLNRADFPALQVLDNGDWVAHWLLRSGSGRYSYDIRSTRSRDGGDSWSAPFTLHDDGTQSEHGFVAYAPAGGDAVWVAWLDGRHTAGNGDHGDGAHAHHAAAGAMSLRVARLDREGVSVAQELDDRVCDCCQVDAARAGAATLLVYRDRSDDDLRDISLLRHDGERWQPAQALFADGWRIAGCPVNGPAIAARGRHVAAAAYSEAGGEAAVRLRSSDDAGLHWDPPVLVAGAATLGRLDLAALDDGRFLLARVDSEAGDAVLRLSLHGQGGEALAQIDLARMPGSRLVGFPRLAVQGNTAFVAWTRTIDGRPQVRASRLRVDGCHTAQ